MLKPIIIKAINRLQIETVVVSNKRIKVGDSPFISYKIVESGIDEADHHIVEITEENMLVITADIPLADRVVSKGATALNYRGEVYTESNIKHHLAMRNLMDSIRESGEKTSGPAPFSKKDVEKFANGLNSYFQKKF
jgi:uncharacterized protein YaiI (UPF0178 family)